jgi:hypothetical protein
VNQDTTIALEQTYYAPTTGAPNDDFIIVCTKFFSKNGASHADLLLGDVIDWDIPSDPNAENISGTAGDVVWLKGSDSDATPTACTPFAQRWAGSAFLGMYTSTEKQADNCANDRDRYGSYAADNSQPQQDAPNGVLDSAIVWADALAKNGTFPIPDTVDHRVYTTYKHQYTLPATETLTVYTAHSTVYNAATSATIEDNLKNACAWYETNLRPGCAVCGCCVGNTGNVDGDPGDIVDIADLTVLIDHLFITFVGLTCAEEGNVDGDPGGVVDIADLTALIDHLFITFPPTAPC